MNRFNNGSRDQGNQLYPSDCGLYKRPFICALYPRIVATQDHRSEAKHQVAFKRNENEEKCSVYSDQLSKCTQMTVDDCMNGVIKNSCEYTCCLLGEKHGDKDDCSANIDRLSSARCERLKKFGFCPEMKLNWCARTCCGIEDAETPATTPETAIIVLDASKSESEPEKGVPILDSDSDVCDQLEDLDSARKCLAHVFREDNCNSNFLKDPCSRTCCEAQLLKEEDTESDSVRRHGYFTPSSTTLTTTTTYTPCLEFTDNLDDCIFKALDDPSKCDRQWFRNNCEQTCCFVEPPPCISEVDEKSEAYCRKRLLQGECRTPRVYRKCTRTCCENVGGSPSSTTWTTTSTSTTTTTHCDNTTMNETTTTESTTTSPTTEFQLCKEYYDRASDEKCEKRVNNSNCKTPISDETRCQYSCCIAMFELTTEAPTTTEVVTTMAPDDDGLDECSGLSDIGKLPFDTENFCAAMLVGDLCSFYDLRKLCEFSCCMNDYAHDEDNHDNNDPKPNDDCDEQPDDVYDYPFCVETYTLGRCDSSFGCETTCCLWANLFFGTQCLAYIDIMGYEYCTLNCMDCPCGCSSCACNSMCKHVCERTVCLYCDNPYDWPPSTEAPSECLELTNDDSGVDCGAIVLMGLCDNPVNDGSGFYDYACNFACCAAYQFQFEKRSGDKNAAKRQLNYDGTTMNTTSVLYDVTTETKPVIATETIVENPDVQVSIQETNVTRQARHAVFDYEGLPCVNPITLQNDPDCKYEARQKRESEKESNVEALSAMQVIGRELQLEPSIVFTASILIVMRICLY